MREQGLETDLRDVAHAEDVEPDDYAFVAAGGSLHMGHHQDALVEWVTARRVALDRRPSAFFSVSLLAAEDSEKALGATQDCVVDFCDETGWTPARTECIAGCLQYREYDPFTRQLMRLLMKREGHPTDASHDYDYTDWPAVERFGRELAALAGAAA